MRSVVVVWCVSHLLVPVRLCKSRDWHLTEPQKTLQPLIDCSAGPALSRVETCVRPVRNVVIPRAPRLLQAYVRTDLALCARFDFKRVCVSIPSLGGVAIDQADERISRPSSVGTATAEGESPIVRMSSPVNVAFFVKTLGWPSGKRCRGRSEQSLHSSTGTQEMTSRTAKQGSRCRHAHGVS